MSSRRGPAQEHVLQGTAHRRVVRVGDTVRRPLTPWSRSVHELLLHLESVGYPFSPRFLGIDDQRREVLSFIPGTSGSDGYVEGLERGGDSWANVVSETGLRRFAGFLRGYHDAVAGYRPPESACWVTGSGAGGPGDVICHGDYGPWNVIWERETPAGLIDWDFAHPGPAWDDVTYALRFVAPFVDDEQAVSWMRHPAPPARGRRLEVFLDAYSGTGVGSTSAVVDDVIARLERTIGLVAQLASAGHEPQVTWVADGWLGQLRDQARWIGRHRELFTPPAGRIPPLPGVDQPLSAADFEFKGADLVDQLRCGGAVLLRCGCRGAARDRPVSVLTRTPVSVLTRTMAG